MVAYLSTGLLGPRRATVIALRVGRGNLATTPSLARTFAWSGIYAGAVMPRGA